MIVVSIVFFTIIGGLLGSMYYIGAVDKEGAKFVRLKALAISLAFGIVVGGLLGLETKADQKEWNCGQCPTCSVEWEFKGASQSKNSKTYYYSCPECNEVIEQNR